MSWGDTFSNFVDSLYATAIASDNWGDWTAQAAAQFGGIATGFAVYDKSTARLVNNIRFHPDPKLLERYAAEEIWRLDPQLPMMNDMDRLIVFTDLDCLDRGDATTREYLHWQASNTRVGHFLSVATPVSADIVAGFSVHRHVADGTVSSEAIEQLTAMAPHVRRALELGFAHTQLLENAYWDGLLGQATDAAALLLDDRGRLISADPAATALLCEAQGLRLAHKHLIALDPASDNALQAAIAHATATHGGLAGTARIKRRASGNPLIVTAYPLVRRSRALAPFEAAALVRIVDPERRPPTRHRLWQQAFQFTPRETELAAELVAGHSLESAAAVLDISYNTARAHLRALFGKTGCVRQTDLVRMLMMIG